MFLLLLSALALAEKQPMQIYTTADGLPSNQINCSLSDSHGFLWFCTREGLSRFDGYTFTNYGVDQGLPDRVVNTFLETKHGEYWVGTTRGVALFNPKPSNGHPMFAAYGENEIGKVSDLVEDAEGTVWVAGDFGVFNLTRSNGTWSLRRSDVPVQQGNQAEGFLADHEGNLWIAHYQGDGHAELWRRSHDGKIDILKDPFLFNGGRITSMTEDSYRRIWLSTHQGLALLSRHPQPGGRIIEHIYATLHRQTPEAGTVFQTSDGRLWVDEGGTQEIVTDAKGRIQLRMFDPNGSGFNMEDSAGNLWNANRKTERAGFVSFGHEDGLRTEDIRSIFEGIDGALYVVTGIHSRYIHRLEGSHFTAVAPKVPSPYRKRKPDSYCGAGHPGPGHVFRRLRFREPQHD
jgi:ligand-binding sensor domain-containing protein